MFGGLLGTVAGKIIAAVTGVAGVAGGLAAAGALPDIGTQHSASASGEASTPAGSTSASAEASVSGPTGPEVPEVEVPELPVGAGDALAIATQARQTASEARAAASECVNTIRAEVIALVSSVRGATNPDQADELVEQAREIGAKARACAEAARELAQHSVDEASEARGLLARVPVVGGHPANGSADAGYATARTAVADANEIASDALDMAFGTSGDVTEIATQAVGDSIAIQRKAKEAGLKAANSAAGIAGGAAPGLGGTDDLGVPIPGLGGDDLPVVGQIDQLRPTEFGTGLAQQVLSTFTEAVGGGLPVPGGLPGLG